MGSKYQRCVELDLSANPFVQGTKTTDNNRPISVSCVPAPQIYDPVYTINSSHTCLSLSLAFPLPDTRDEVTSRGMTDIWCSGMFIPAEPTGGGRSHTHFLSRCQSKGHVGLNYDTLPAPPLRRTHITSKLNMSIVFCRSSWRDEMQMWSKKQEMTALKWYSCILNTQVCFHLVCSLLD